MPHLVCSLHRHDDVERSEVRCAVRITEVSLHERHALGHLAKVFARELVHRFGEVERGVALDLAACEDLSCEVARP